MNLLICYDGELIKEVTLIGDEIVLGSSESCDIQLVDDDVSSRHAKISRKTDAYVIEDLGSEKGTLRQGKQIKKRELKVGEVYVIGPFEISLGKGGTRSKPKKPSKKNDMNPIIEGLLDHGEHKFSKQGVNFENSEPFVDTDRVPPIGNENAEPTNEQQPFREDSRPWFSKSFKPKEITKPSPKTEDTDEDTESKSEKVLPKMRSARGQRTANPIKGTLFFMGILILGLYLFYQSEKSGEIPSEKHIFTGEPIPKVEVPPQHLAESKPAIKQEIKLETKQEEKPFIQPDKIPEKEQKPKPLPEVVDQKKLAKKKQYDSLSKTYLQGVAKYDSGQLGLAQELFMQVAKEQGHPDYESASDYLNKIETMTGKIVDQKMTRAQEMVQNADTLMLGYQDLKNVADQFPARSDAKKYLVDARSKMAKRARDLYADALAQENQAKNLATALDLYKEALKYAIDSSDPYYQKSKDKIERLQMAGVLK